MIEVKRMVRHQRGSNAERQVSVFFAKPLDEAMAVRFSEIENRADPPYISICYGEDMIEVLGMNDKHLNEGLRLLGFPVPWECTW
jgi:hypothetical protein